MMPYAARLSCGHSRFVARARWISARARIHADTYHIALTALPASERTARLHLGCDAVQANERKRDAGAEGARTTPRLRAEHVRRTSRSARGRMPSLPAALGARRH